MRNSFAVWKGTIMSAVVSVCIRLQNANCQSHGANNVYREYSEVHQRPSAAGKPYDTDNVQNPVSGGYHSLPDVNDNDKWQSPESSGVHHGGGYSNAALTDVTGVTVNGGGPVVVSGGSVVLRPSAGGFVVDGGGIGKFGEPEAVGVQQLPLSAVGPYVAAGDRVLQFGPPPPQHIHPFGHTFFRASGLLQWLLFGKTMFDPPSLDGYSPLCSRLTAVGRFLLDRVFDPLFATGFFMAASYLFRTSVLPRIAHYIHVYAMMKDHVVDDGRFAGGRQISGYLDALTSAVNDAVNDDIPCFQRIVCEAGLQLASSPVARSARRMSKIIISKHELAHVFKESFTGSVSDCSQYMCKIHAKFR
ncbi:uncharacterized protein LOC107883967 isoform X2 [Acyrthosiphon pisum]|uniref:Uncharacterized protein n=1 Tax=Acyrthosiphon pisum TaxID=7029 RepID=A0A8R2NN54_ACYPI|nr:uncharacterized protein LOC107883967 isoform X2 [Acyrthosiphon pisum]